jgi:hypothetical protein
MYREIPACFLLSWSLSFEKKYLNEFWRAINRSNFGILQLADRSSGSFMKNYSSKSIALLSHLVVQLGQCSKSNEFENA